MEELEEKNIKANKPTKVCTGCGRELPLSAFNLNNHSKDGHMGICKECRRRHKNAPTDSKGNPLAQFTARQLMDELYVRGYRGELKYTQIHIIKLGEH